MLVIAHTKSAYISFKVYYLHVILSETKDLVIS